MMSTRMASEQATSSLTNKIDSPNNNNRTTENQPLKKFSLYEFATYEDNAQVIKTFILFSVALAIAPIAVFYFAQYSAVVLLNQSTDGTVVGFSASIASVLFLMASYAYYAYQEEKRDYFQHAATVDKKTE